MPRKARGNEPRPPRRVLIARFSAIGDIAMTLPVVYGICRANPGVAFIYVSRTSMTDMMVNRPPNLTVCGVDIDNHYGGITGMHRLYQQLSSRFDFDAFADLHSVLRTSLLSFWCRLGGVRVARLDKGRRGRRQITSRGAAATGRLKTMEQRYADVFSRLELRAPEPFESVYGPGGAPDEAYAAAAAPKAPGEVWIGVAPFARHAGKIYPPAMMRKAVGLLAAQPGRRIFLFGNAREGELMKDWERDIRGVTSLAGKRLGFGVETALMSRFDAMVSMDSANMHLASLAGTPVVSVWGATHPYCGFTGHGQDAANIVQLNLPCRPCSVFGNRKCSYGDYHCLRNIAPETIVERVNNIIKNNGQRHI